ncbi:RNA polymerase sigma factor [Paludisphaera sp.]|uniref:RNA polymerase sigma factor n=1 Tax=Paludisphaera sp. TaxID=2017432 RepID=UPI00301D08A2
MTTPARRTAAGPLKALMTLGAFGEAPDARLLDVYRSGRLGADEAFRVMVERHGPMVLAVCRGVAADRAEADDAFQATFLILARRAGAIRRADSLGPWLHGVALRVARRARSRARARSARLRLVPPEALARAVAPPDRSDLIHAEIDRLPDRERRPLILCALEGFSYEQAARTLGISEPTLRGRLHRARKRLESRLRAEGVEAPRPLAPPVPPAALLEIAIGRATAASPVPPSISSLAKGALVVMSMSSWKPAVLSSLATLGIVGAVALAQQPGPGAERGGGGPPPAQVEAPKAEPPARPNPPTEEELEVGNARIRAVLAAPCPFEFADDPDDNIGLEDLLRRIREATATADEPGIPVHINPDGLSIADGHMASSARFRPKDRPLGEALGDYLAPLGLGYAVDRGFLMIDSHASAADRRIDAVERKLDALIKKLESAPIFFEEARPEIRLRER